MAIFAHPDDEGQIAGIMAKYASQGTDACLVCATRGELGTTTDLSLLGGKTLAQIREEEEYLPAIKVTNDISKLKARKNKEILVDVGTADFESMKLALTMAHRVVVPVPPSQADIWSTQRFLGFVGSVNGSRKKPEVMGFVNRADTHHAIRESDEAAAALVALPGIRFVKSRLAQRTVFRRSFSEGLAVFELEPRGKGAKEFTSLAAVLYPEILK